MTVSSKQESMLDDCYLIMAKIIRDGGTIYLPIFERLHKEKLQRQNNIDLINAALLAAESALK